MSNVIRIPVRNPDQVIDVTRVVAANRTRSLRPGLISPDDRGEYTQLHPSHAAEPIKDIDDINRICDFLKSNKRFRDYMLFVVGINVGLRVSDLLQLRFHHLINDDLIFRDRFSIFEQKTSNTRKVKRDRYITVNDAVIEAVTLYLENTPGVKLSDYMFRNQGPNSTGENKPLNRKSVDRMMKGLATDLGLGCKMSTHTLRKTFGFHQLAMSNNDHRKLLLLQRMFGHSSPNQTLEYIGITADEIDEAYKKLNLGASCNYLAISVMGEVEPAL